MKSNLKITYLIPSIIPGHITVTTQKILEPANWVLVNLPVFYLKFTTQ